MLRRLALLPSSDKSTKYYLLSILDRGNLNLRNLILSQKKDMMENIEHMSQFKITPSSQSIRLHHYLLAKGCPHIHDISPCFINNMYIVTHWGDYQTMFGLDEWIY
jgi:hypothetical protein